MMTSATKNGDTGMQDDDWTQRVKRMLKAETWTTARMSPPSRMFGLVSDESIAGTHGVGRDGVSTPATRRGFARGGRGQSCEALRGTVIGLFSVL